VAPPWRYFWHHRASKRRCHNTRNPQHTPTPLTMSTLNLADNKTWQAVKPFMNGGLSGMGATVCIQPLDIIKASVRVSETSEQVL